MSTKNETPMNLLHAGKIPNEISKALNVHRVTVYEIRNKFKTTGNVGRKPGSGRPRSARAPVIVKSIRNKIRYNLVGSMRKMAKEARVSEKTVRRIVNEDMGAKSRARTKKISLMIKPRQRDLKDAKPFLEC